MVFNEGFIPPTVIDQNGESAVSDLFEVAQEIPLPSHTHAVVSLTGGADIVKECPEAGVAYQSPYEYNGQIQTNCIVDGQEFTLQVNEETHQYGWVIKE